MYDLHNHLLPNIDDGSPDIATSIALAKIAMKEGITHMVCTPHIHPGRFDNTLQTIDKALTLFKAALKQENINLHVESAAEVRIGSEIIQSIKMNRLPFLGGWCGNKALLLEFPYNSIPLGSEKLTQWLFSQGIITVIAHPERNQVIQETPSKLKMFLEQGCLLQITAGSLTGNFGKKAKLTAKKLLQEKRVTLIATDAHNIDYRPPLLQEGLKQAIEIMGEIAATKLVLENPQKIAESKFKS